VVGKAGAGVVQKMLQVSPDSAQIIPRSIIILFKLGFAAFFFIFEISRRAGAKGKSLLENRLSRSHRLQEGSRVGQLPAIVNGITLVSGGVSMSNTICRRS